MAVTIKDVAALAGVSTSTVSRVCNGNTAIARQTRERVLKAMAELGYEAATPEQPAPARIVTVAVVLPPSDWETYENVFYLKALRGIGCVCSQRQAAVVLVNGSNQQELLSSVQQLHTSGRADGFVLLYSRRKDAVAEYLAKNALPYVIVGKVYDQQDKTVSVDNDNLLAGKEAADYLFRLGHRRIGCLGGRNDYAFTSDRLAGYQLSMLQKGLPLCAAYTVEMEGISARDLQPLQALLSREDRPTAFVVCDDLLAMALERVCTHMGLNIPGDISLIAFNDSLYTRLVSPQMTTVDVNAYQLGYEAAAQVMKHILEPDQIPTRTVVPHKIVERNSCRRLSGE